jgi:hypothetical protein
MMNVSNTKPILMHVLLPLLILLSGCATLPNAKTVEFNNRRVEYSLVGNGISTVVFENGLDEKIKNG